MTLQTVDLNDKFDLDADRVYITGTQALVRLCLMQAELDRRQGLNTAGYVSGYRGSPLGGIDLQFPRAQEFLQRANVVFEPALNEDLAATAIWGTQQAEMRGDGVYDGVFSMWYGKGPGVDRSGDAFRHGNLAGSSAYGGVLVLMGDDHTCESSTTCHQSEYALMDAMIPVLNPANVQEMLDFGLHGWALSRFAGVWCGLKCVKDNVESSASVDARTSRFTSVLPDSLELPEDGLNIRTGDTPQAQEARLHRHKIRAAQAYAYANTLDQIVVRGGAHPRTGIISTGKSYMDTVQALEQLGVNDETRAAELGITLYKVAMSWPLEPAGIAAFARGLDLLIVVEEKRGLIEDQVRALLYGTRDAPQIVGKRDEQGDVLFQSEAALNPVQIGAAIGSRVAAVTEDHALRARSEQLTAMLNTERDLLDFQRKPYFCAGCPHNSSTVLPQGSRGYAGIGCHWMVQFMDRNVEGYTHMGGEGANWIGESKFSSRRHVFQNVGDGTYNHSGLLAIRAAVAARTNLTFKILYNDAVAMTGGQALEGDLSVWDIAAEVTAAGVRRVALVSDDPSRHSGTSLPRGVTIDHRDNIKQVQKSLSRIDGVTVLLYEQTCAAEKRRRRKRGLMVDPPRRLFINEQVCEGCGDCGVQSNCVAVLPVETEFGRKRKIDQTACNKDFSCVNGFCPSFVTVEGGELRRPDPAAGDLPPVPEPPNRSVFDRPYGIVLTGVGGTGVVTVGALLGMAAHLESKGCGVIDMAGLAQKGGAVVSHIKLAPAAEDINAIRIAPGGADLVLGCDLVVSAGEQILTTIDPQRSQIVINTHEMMTGEFTRQPDFNLPVSRMLERLKAAVAPAAACFVNTTRLAATLLGDSVAANLFLLGVAYQRGLIPLTSGAIERAIEVNDVAVRFNKRAFQWGRLWVHDQEFVAASANSIAGEVKVEPASLNEVIDRRQALLIEYHGVKYARRYRALVERVRQTDRAPGRALTESVVRYAYKLMAIKDEYEVARAYTDPQFTAQLKQQFAGKFKLRVHLAPPILSRRNPDSGLVRKHAFGGWIFLLFRLLAKVRRVRGTAIDIFGYTRERRQERALIQEYESLVAELIASYDDNDYQTAVALASLPEKIRGFGHIKLDSIENYRQQKQVLLANLKPAYPTSSEAA